MAWKIARRMLLIVAATGVAHAEHPTLIVRPKMQCGIPNYPYKPTSEPTRSTATVVSWPALNLPAETEQGVGTAKNVPRVVTESLVQATSAKRVLGKTTEVRTERTTTTQYPESTVKTEPVLGVGKTFTFQEQVLRLDHCELSKASMTLFPDGFYVVSFRANFVTLDKPGTSPLVVAPSAPTGLRRSLFCVGVRMQAWNPLSERGALTSVTLDQLALQPFWVNRGESSSKVFSGSNEQLRRLYPVIERIEMDFTYR